MLSQIKSNFNASILEKAILEGDLTNFSSIEKIKYVKEICGVLGLNPLTKPIELIRFKGKEKMYFTKDATEQLRKINKVSINNLETKLHEGGLYIVIAHATTPDGRSDCSTGAILVKGLIGEDLANAMMKAETKAKRRVTLSICGLGFIDESEAYSIPGAKKINLEEEEKIENKKLLMISEEKATSEQIKEIVELVKELNIDQLIVEKWLEKGNANTFDELNTMDIQKCIDYLKNKIQGGFSC